MVYLGPLGTENSMGPSRFQRWYHRGPPYSPSNSLLIIFEEKNLQLVCNRRFSEIFYKKETQKWHHWPNKGSTISQSPKLTTTFCLVLYIEWMNEWGKIGLYTCTIYRLRGLIWYLCKIKGWKPTLAFQCILPPKFSFFSFRRSVRPEFLRSFFGIFRSNDNANRIYKCVQVNGF